jgi:hypothetical protein
MTAYGPIPLDFTMAEDTEVRGIGGLRPVRITRSADGASALLHEVSAGALALRGAEMGSPLPDFSQPFVTKIYGPVSADHRMYLVEPLPHCVPLVEIWQAALTEAPRTAPSVLRAILRQTGRAIQRAHGEEQPHGAVCIENVVLTTDGIYGLLQASVRSGEDRVWLRPMNETAGQRPRANEVDDESAIVHMAGQLADWAFALTAVPEQVKTELYSVASKVCS